MPRLGKSKRWWGSADRRSLYRQVGHIQLRGSRTRELADAEIFLSVLTIGEIRRGIESIRRRDPDAATALDSWLARVVEAHRDRIIGIDRAIAEEWGRLNVPDPLPVVDGLLAATGKVTGLTLATRNVSDVESTGVTVFNPFGNR